MRLIPDCVGQPAGGGEADRSTPGAQAGKGTTARAGRTETRRGPGRGPARRGLASSVRGPAHGPAPSRAALLRAPPAGGSESEAERLTSRRHRQTSPRVRRGKQPERRRRRRRAAAGGGGGRDRRGAGSSEPKGTRSDSDDGDPVTVREVSGARAWRRGWRGPAGGSRWGAARAGRGGRGGGGARTAATVARARGRWLWGPPPRAPLASAGEPPRSGRGGTSAAAGSSALCGRGQMSEIWRRK